MVRRFSILVVSFLLFAACGRMPSQQYQNGSQNYSSNACSGKPVNVSFLCSDGCNQCRCNSKGEMSSTLMACASF